MVQSLKKGMTMQGLFFLLCILHLGYALSTNGTCTVDDALICGRCTNTACEVHNSNFIGSFTSVLHALLINEDYSIGASIQQKGKNHGIKIFAPQEA